MAQLNINIPNDKINLILEAFTRVRGIGTNGQTATPAEFKQEIIREIKHTVKQFKAMETMVEDPDIAMD